MKRTWNAVNPQTVAEYNRRIESAVSKRDVTTKPIVALTYQMEIDWLVEELRVFKKLGPAAE